MESQVASCGVLCGVPCGVVGSCHVVVQRPCGEQLVGCTVDGCRDVVALCPDKTAVFCVEAAAFLCDTEARALRHELIIPHIHIILVINAVGWTGCLPLVSSRTQAATPGATV